MSRGSDVHQGQHSDQCLHLLKYPLYLLSTLFIDLQFDV